jgi:hypothetical protein
MNKLIVLLIFIFLSSVVDADDVLKIECVPKGTVPSFKIKGDISLRTKVKFWGNAHSFSTVGRFKSISGCRAPWYEKFQMKGNYDVKFLYHEHEYTENCILRFVFSKGKMEGRMWVYSKDKPRERSEIMKASCSVVKK